MKLSVPHVWTLIQRHDIAHVGVENLRQRVRCRLHALPEPSRCLGRSIVVLRAAPVSAADESSTPLDTRHRASQNTGDDVIDRGTFRYQQERCMRSSATGARILSSKRSCGAQSPALCTLSAPGLTAMSKLRLVANAMARRESC